MDPAPMRRLVTTEAEWRALHAQLFQANESALPGTPPLDLGGIDWARETVYVTYTGEPSQCRGVGLHSAYVTDERVLLRQSEYTYQTAALDGEDEPAAPIERPWGVFRVPRLGAGGALVVERDRQGLILGPPMWTELARFTLE